MIIIADKFLVSDSNGIIIGKLSNRLPKNHSPIQTVNGQIASLPNDCKGTSDIVSLATELRCKVEYNGSELLLNVDQNSQTLLQLCNQIQKLNYSFIIKEHSAWFRIPMQVLKWWQRKIN